MKVEKVKKVVFLHYVLSSAIGDTEQEHGENIGFVIDLVVFYFDLEIKRGNLESGKRFSYSKKREKKGSII